MMGNSCRQFGLLLWKNWVLQYRKPVVTVFEILLPTIFAAILIAIRTRVDSNQISQPTSWTNFPVEYFDLQLSGKFDLVPRIAYAPINPLTENLMESVTLYLSDGLTVVPKAQGFFTEQEMTDFLLFENKTVNNTKLYLGGMVFAGYFEHNVTNISSLPADLAIKFRLSSTPKFAKGGLLAAVSDSSRWQTQYMYPLYQRVGPRHRSSRYGADPDYFMEGFLALQMATMNSLLYHINPEAPGSLKVRAQRFPYPPYNNDQFVLVLQQQFPVVLMLSFIFIALNIVKDVVHEKERKLKESMKMMGLPGWLHWSAWFTKYTLFNAVTVLIITTFFCIHVTHGRIIGQTDFTVLLVFLLLYSMATICFCFMVSCFFNKANSGAAAGGILFFFTYVPFFFIQPRYALMSLGEKLAPMLLHNQAMAFGGQLIGLYEGTGAGVQWHNIHKPASVDDNLTMLHVFMMFGVDSVVYSLITWYVEAVKPGDFGVPQPFWFPFTLTYWCGSRRKSDNPSSETTPLIGPARHRPSVGCQVDPEFFEKEPIGIPAPIRIKGLTKTFENNVAVDRLTLNMFEGQITALLGHNGAGKTTSMSMLTGFIPPSAGTALVNGFDIRRDISGVRQSLGLCPQHDVLFDTLTTREHLLFFGKLKGVPKDKLNANIDRLLNELRLTQKRDEYSKTLSGGHRRKLSVAIALIGDSKIIILDEPTSGMDPDARRLTLDILQRYRPGRTMLLTTHYMDEADQLGDRIAIMANGVVQCCGSSLFLKNKYGAGYHMTIVKEQSCDVGRLTRLVLAHVPSARLSGEVGAEIAYVLPHEEAHRFEKLFAELERRRVQLGVSSYGASVTTMEEVFLKVGEELASTSEMRDYGTAAASAGTITVNNSTSQAMNAQPPAYNPPRSHVISHSRKAGIPLATGSSLEEPRASVNYFNEPCPERAMRHTRLLALQFSATLWKRIKHTLRNRLVTACQLAVPLLFTTIVLIIMRTLPRSEDSPPLNLTLDRFYGTDVPYGYNGTENSRTLAEYYSTQFLGRPRVNNIVDVDQSKDFNYDREKNLTMVDQYLLAKAANGISSFDYTYLVSSMFEGSGKTAGDMVGSDGVDNATVDVTFGFNAQAYHTPAIALAALANATLNYFQTFAPNLTSTSSSRQAHSTHLTMINHPLPRTSRDKVNDLFSDGYSAFSITFNVLVGMSFLSSSFVIFLVKERASKAKHCQFVSGLNASVYWFATFLWDLVNFLIPCALLVADFAAFDVKAYYADFRGFQILLLFFLFGWAMIPLMYLLSHIFTVPASGFVWITIFNILSGSIDFFVQFAEVPFPDLAPIAGIGTLLAVDILAIPQLNLRDLSDALKWVFMTLLPNFCLARGLEDFYMNHVFVMDCDTPHMQQELCPGVIALNLTFFCCKGHCGDNCFNWQRNYLSWEAEGIGRYLVFLTIQGAVFMSILLAMESGFFHYVGSRLFKMAYLPDEESNEDCIQEDGDVSAERRRINGKHELDLFQTDHLILRELVKVYDKNVAVDRLTLGIAPNECFGLLGVNGAGKTSTFKMITGDEMISSGRIFLLGFDVEENLHKVRQFVGYCPQFDALIDQMTGREMLQLYARIRGLERERMHRQVNELIECLQLTEHADKLTMQYSGGNKRKLSTAIALVGNPQIIFLDEPSTGLDPVARRLLWDTLARLRESGKTLILTSHSMEECEALCTRLAVMVNGRFRCLGSTQHLKTKFGQGYTLMARVAYPEEGGLPDVESLRRFIESTFPGSVLKDIHQGLLHYHLADPSLSWAQVFGTMERAKREFNIENYSVSQTTLEQVFLNFARSQVPPTEVSGGCLAGLRKFFRACRSGSGGTHASSRRHPLVVEVPT